MLRNFIAVLFALIMVSGGIAQDDKPVIDTSTFDQNTRPQDDLYGYVNGTWLKNTKIPDEKSNYGSFIALADLSQERIKSLIDQLASTEQVQGSDAQKIADVYNSFMDEAAIEEAGLAPIAEDMAGIDGIDSKDALIRRFAILGRTGISSPMGFFVMTDARNSTVYLPHLAQSGTTLPDRDYYLKDDDKYVSAREAMKTYIVQLFEMAGIPNGPDAAVNILAIESKLAEAQWSRVELRDAEKRYNKMPVAKLSELMPSVNWQAFFSAAGTKPFVEINVVTPSFFEKLDGIIAEFSVDQWKQYLQFQALDGAAPFLPKKFEDAHFELHSKEFAGIEAQKPRWKRGVETVGGLLGESIGKLYVAKHFKPEAKARMKELVDNLLGAFDSSIDTLAWMTDETKAKAKKKLSMINTKIGYPDKWRDYSNLKIDKDLVGNIKRAQAFEYQRMIDRIGKPVDREEWGMTPQTVNAYYNPTMNEIVFPAAILQSPFFSMDAPDALNYGGIGAVIGHEISHAFDDQGSRYDGEGNLNNWWTEADAKAFKALTEKLVAQYAAYEPLPSNKVNGKLTLGENIADLSGLEIAHRAFRKSLNGTEPAKVAGWNGDQLFFVGWSRVWQRKYRDAEMVRRLLTDPHSPSEYRANGPVTNIDAFYKAFELKESDRLFKPEDQRIKIW